MKFHFKSFLSVVVVLGIYVPCKIWLPAVAEGLEPLVLSTLAPLGFLSIKE